MNTMTRLSAGILFSLGLPALALAQDQPAPPSAAPALAEPATGNPNLSVATVKMDGGIRASKIIGASVTGGGNSSQDLGTVNDLILDKDGHAILGVISVGSVLGVGGKLVAVPYTSLHMAGDGKVTLQDGSKDSLGKMPGFTYTN